MFKKIEIDLLFFILCEAFMLLFFFKESFLTLIFGIILGLLLIILTKKIKYHKITKIILFIISFILSIFTLYYTSSFINYNILKNYSLVFIIIPFLAIAIYLVSKEYHTFIKSLEIAFYFFLFIKIISFLLIIPKIDFHNYYILHNNTFSYHFIFIGLIILYLYQTINYLTGYRLNKNFFIFLLNPLLIKTMTILVLGNSLFIIYKYPYVNYLKTIKYFDFIERMDGILSFEYLFCFFYLFSFTLLSCKLLYKKSQ